MPKILIARIQCPSGSRPESMKPWLNTRIHDDRVKVIEVSEETKGKKT